MDNSILKACADSLRAFAKEKYDVKLKAAHAHELVAAYMGYKSKNGLLADEKHPIANLSHCEIFVGMPDEFINGRRLSLQGLPTELPDSNKLGEVIYGYLFSNELLVSSYLKFKDFLELAKYLIKNSDTYQEVFKFYPNAPVEHILDTSWGDNEVILSVVHATPTDDDKLLSHGETIIELPRVAGRVGFGKPRIRVVQWTSGAKKAFARRKVQS